MKRFGILAYPASHSRSPEMHNAAFHALKIDALFEKYEIPPEKLQEFLEEKVRGEKKINGLAVSIPHKETIIPFLDTVDDSVQAIGACNTVYWKNNQLCGTNTDSYGFSKALSDTYNVTGKNILVVGAGGAARAVVYALLQDNAGSITITNRTKEKGRNFAQDFAVSFQEKGELEPEQYDLIVQTTPLGMQGGYEKISPLPSSFWRENHTAFDIVYTPEKTQFLLDAEGAGGTIISGKNMFLCQGMKQFEIWTGEKAPETIMRESI